ncbi:cytidine deaminase [Neptunitalea lumnitzerae]|uniref:Cytidine deaminase n=1 Tax=Neptunitalea lumnitzerae TaxID=2965509 RepID=A0ABQ5MH93_9FLAO|nr:cytidine deaminase [Neptunitalea sp. Y10]GLB48784.1 cytidine deaminase [Neptunitalea sp. Y10]
MKEIQINSTIQVYDSVQELPKNVQELMEKAVEARKKAYAPYSKFQVGAALMLANGEAVSGNNQENAAYPSGLCAERVAVFYAGAHYPGETVEMMAISATSLDKPVTTPVPPCGACRQAIAEYEIKQEKPIALYFMGEKGAVYKTNSLKDLLPLIFDGSML